MGAAIQHFACPLPDNRWAAAHIVPGTQPPVLHVDVDCPSQAAATSEAARLNGQHARRALRDANDAGLRGITLQVQP